MMLVAKAPGRPLTDLELRGIQFHARAGYARELEARS